jgi:hypothetical protein
MALAMLSVALLLAFVRLVRGPSLPDRVVALDLISILAAGITVDSTREVCGGWSSHVVEPCLGGYLQCNQSARVSIPVVAAQEKRR